MNDRTVAKALLVVALLTVVVGLIAGVLVLNPGYGATPQAIAPSVTTTEHEPAPSQSSTLVAQPSLDDIGGLPVHITVLHDNQPLIDASIVSITLDSDGVLAPPKGRAGVYYSPADWSTIPGDLDRYRGIIAGHDVTGTGARDVFYNLGKVDKGDLIVLTYQLKDGDTTTAEFRATADAVSAPKMDVTRGPEYQYLWQPMGEPGRHLSVLSCDLSKAVPGQHSRNNWIVNATRVR